jgi:hypothetical protein
VRDLAEAGLQAARQAQAEFQDRGLNAEESRQTSARALLALLSELYQLRRFARLGAPHIDDLGGLGTGLDDSDAPTIMSVADGKEGWDFQPWLAEKVGSAERLVFEVADICAPDGAAETWPPWRRIAQPEDKAAECCRLLAGVEAYLDAILGMIDSGELKIPQLTAMDSDDEDDGAGA